jgi:hypothetical protein
MKKEPAARPARSPKGEEEATRRRERLAASLRENLKKRKEQSRRRTPRAPSGKTADEG